ncbi:hypothetical protein [Streptomyces sp. NPDC001741]|uniref:hypothetical protein n=1 Tax=Streptomyces sp. NPDC001741 TaxID=3364605 RepID=UPI00368B6D0D
MRTRTTTATLLAAALLALTGCSSTAADPKACKAAMAKDFSKAMAAGGKAEQADRPDACDGIDDATAQRLAGEVATEWAAGEKAAADLEQDLADLEAEIDDTLDGLETSAP